jgi:hypothetical protein
MRALPFLATALLGSIAAAQEVTSVSASSPSWFLSVVEIGDGGEMNSPNFVLRASLGYGVVADPGSASTNNAFAGGFPAMAAAALSGSPLVTGVEPFFVPQRGSQTAVLHGVDLTSAGATNVVIGGQLATVQSRTSSEIRVTLPQLSEPGFQPVTLVNPVLGTTQVQTDVGVLPMLYNREPLNPATPISLRFRGTAGDFMMLAMGFGAVATPLPVLPEYNYGLLIDPGLIADAFFLGVSDPSGELRIPGPALPTTGSLYVQALVLTSNPGYAPGSWTNVVRL